MTEEQLEQMLSNEHMKKIPLKNSLSMSFMSPQISEILPDGSTWGVNHYDYMLIRHIVNKTGRMLRYVHDDCAQLIITDCGKDNPLKSELTQLKQMNQKMKIKLSAYRATGLSPDEINVYVKCQSQKVSRNVLKLQAETDRLTAIVEAYRLAGKYGEMQPNGKHCAGDACPLFLHGCGVNPACLHPSEYEAEWMAALKGENGK